MIADRIIDYLRGDLSEAPDSMLDVAASMFRASLKRNLTAAPREERRHISASSPWYCARKMLYGMRGAESVPLNPRARIAFTMGDTLEQMAVILARLSGVEVLSPAPDGTQESATIQIAGREVSCHLDATIRGPSGEVVPVDVKSMADYGFGEFEQAIRDPGAKWWMEERWGYLTQLRIYMLAKQAEYGLFLAINKNTGLPAELMVSRDPEWEREIAQRMAFVNEHDAAGTTPPRPPWATTVTKSGDNLRPDGSKGAVEEISSWRCNYCPKVATCFEGFSLVALKSKPAWRRAC